MGPFKTCTSLSVSVLSGDQILNRPLASPLAAILPFRLKATAVTLLVCPRYSYWGKKEAYFLLLSYRELTRHPQINTLLMRINEELVTVTGSTEGLCLCG